MFSMLDVYILLFLLCLCGLLVTCMQALWEWLIYIGARSEGLYFRPSWFEPGTPDLRKEMYCDLEAKGLQEAPRTASSALRWLGKGLYYASTLVTGWLLYAIPAVALFLLDYIRRHRFNLANAAMLAGGYVWAALHLWELMTIAIDTGSHSLGALFEISIVSGGVAGFPLLIFGVACEGKLNGTPYSKATWRWIRWSAWQGTSALLLFTYYLLWNIGGCCIE